MFYTELVFFTILLFQQYATHACYHTVTSDVIVPVRTAVTSVVVQYATLRDFEEEYGNTRVAVVTVTDTQVDVS